MNEPTFQHKVKAFVEESGGEVKTVEIREALDLPDSIVKNALRGLVETGLLKRIKRGHYILDGHRQLPLFPPKRSMT